MSERRIASLSQHAWQRLAQRNLDYDDVCYVIRYGRTHYAGHAMFVHLGLRDIPAEDRRVSRLRRLEGTVLVLDPGRGEHVTTAYRNRRRGSRDIKRKSKRGLGHCGESALIRGS